MSRLKFRGWHRENKVMLSNFMVNGPDAIDDIFQNINFEVMQYTCLNDVNGVGIYEGDIVRLTEHVGGNFIDNIYKNTAVIWSGFGFQLEPIPRSVYTLCLDSTSSYEVIGNIYENPELLK